MSRQVQLAIEVSDERALAVKTMAARSRALQIVDDITDCNAVVTNQVEVALGAMADNKHVLVLDPFAIPDTDRDRLESSGRAAAALPLRFQSSIGEVSQALDDGRLGRPGLLRIHWWHPSSHPASDFLASELDLAIWLMRDSVSEVYGCERPGYLQAHLGFSCGSMALIDIDTSVPDENSYYSLSLIGSSGAAYADDHRNMNLVFRRGGPAALRTPLRKAAIARMIDTFAKTITVGTGLGVAWQQVSAALEIADQVRAAAKDGNVIAGGNRG